MGGDFSEVYYEKIEMVEGRRTSNIQVKKFHEWIAEFTLIDIPIKNLQ